MRGTPGTPRLVYVRRGIAPRRSQDQDQKEEERGKTLLFFSARQSGNACSVCPLPVDARLWGAVRYGTDEKKRVAASHHSPPPSRFLLNSSSTLAYLAIRANVPVLGCTAMENAVCDREYRRRIREGEE